MRSEETHFQHLSPKFERSRRTSIDISFLREIFWRKGVFERKKQNNTCTILMIERENIHYDSPEMMRKKSWFESWGEVWTFVFHYCCNLNMLNVMMTIRRSRGGTSEPWRNKKEAGNVWTKECRIETIVWSIASSIFSSSSPHQDKWANNSG